MHNLAGKTAVSLGTMGGLVTYASPDNLPAGVSPRCHDMDFEVGSTKSRKGTRGVYSFSADLVTNPGTHAESATWSNPDNAFSTTLYASSVGLDSGTIDITQFAFNLTQMVIGIKLNCNANCTVPAGFTASLILEGNVVGVPKVSTTLPVTSFGGNTDLWGTSGLNFNNTTFGVRFEATSEFELANYLLNGVSFTLYLAAASANFQYVKSFPTSNGTIRTLAIDAAGEWWVANETSDPGVFFPLLSGLPQNGYARSVTAFDREYVAFSDLHTGNDIPRQYTGDWIDRITQVGPGEPPTFTPQAASDTTYAISTINQPAAHSQGSSYFLQSTGPGSSTAGNVITFYYLDSTVSPTPDEDLVTAVNSGFPVYVYASFTGNPHAFGPLVVQVTSVGLASPPGQPRPFYYFTFVVDSVAFAYDQGSGHPGYTANYQRTLATMVTAVPVPGLIVGSMATITGASVTNYDSTWLIAQTMNSASMVIVQTSVASNVASYSYRLVSGVAPVAGELITVTGTTNSNGVLNVNNAAIITASGGSTGTFTVNVTAPDAVAAAESGQATTAGTQFAFDPGFALLGSATNPIYGSSTGGTLVFSGTNQFIAPGTRQGVLFFGTRNSAETYPSTPIIFTIPTNTSTLICSQILIGPPDCTYRQIAITEPGQEGIPGGDFYTIDDPVTYTVNGVQYVSNSFRIPNNTDTTISLTFRDSDLLAGRRIDVTGQDLFNQVEIGNPAWVAFYANRMFYGLTQSKLYNLINLSFDGGYHPAVHKLPSGWNIEGSGGELLVSAIFGDSYYITNASTSHYTNASAFIVFPLSRPLGNNVNGALWSDFTAPTLPSDAVIQGIYPVGIASGVFTPPTPPLPARPPFFSSGPNGAGQYFKYGTPVLGNVASGTYFDNFPGSGIIPFQSYPLTEFTGPSIGTDPSLLAGQSIVAQLGNSLTLDDLQDQMAVTGVGYAIPYISATVTIDPLMPPPFTLPDGWSLAWAVPATVATTTPSSQGLINITSSVGVIQPHTGSTWVTVGTFEYTSVFGPVPAAGQQISVMNTVGNSGAYNGVNQTVATATGTTPNGSFTLLYDSIASSPLTAEVVPALALTSTSGGTNTGATTASPAGIATPAPAPSPLPGLITQSAYRDYYGVQIIKPNIPYSVRVTARIPSGNTNGILGLDLFSAQQSIATASIPFSRMTTVFQTFILPLTTGIDVVQSDILLRLYGDDMAIGADVEIDRIEPFPTRQPVNNTDLLVSYIDDPEGVDGDTGNVDTAGENTQPCYGGVVMYDLLYLLKDRSMYYTQDSSGDEPSKWGVHEVSNKAGACGVNAYDSGEEWILMANRNGIYLFTGGEPRKISQEIQQVWDALNWSAGQSIWVRNDIEARKFYVGVPMPTPNFWLPDAPANENPSFPNVILVCTYKGSDTGSAVADSAPVFATQFNNLDTTDLRRKWTIWQIPCPYADFITQTNGEDTPLLLGNGIGNSKVYRLDATNDDGAEIPWRYVTYGFGSDDDVKKYPALGPGRKRWSYLLAVATGVGKAIVSFFSQKLDGTVQYTVPGGILLNDDDGDRERPLNIPGNRVYVEWKSGGLDSEIDLSQMTMVGTKDVFNAIRGRE